MNKSNEISIEIKKILSCKLELKARSIIDSPFCDEILQRIPVQDAFLIVKDNFGGDSQFLLPYLPPERIITFIDIDCWNGDTPSVENLLEWLKELQFASDDTLMEAINSIDPELIILLYQPVLKVVVTSPTDDNIPDILEAGFETVDNNYFFSFTEDSEDTRLLRFILDKSFMYNQDMYFRILEGVRWELGANMEENAYQQRTIRLTELGFPPPDEASSVYSRIRLDAIVNSGLRGDQIPLIDEPARFFLPTLYQEQLSYCTQLSEAMSKTDAETAEKFAFEMMYLSNKILMADFKSIKETSAIREAVEKAAAITSIGLETTVKTKGLNPSEVLEKRTAQTLFSIGYNLLLGLRDRLMRCMKGLQKNMIPIYLRELFEGLQSKQPVYISGRYITSEDIENLNEAVEYIETLNFIISGIQYQDVSLKETNVGEDGLDMENVILTTLSINVLTEERVFRPLSQDELERFIVKATTLNKNKRRLKAAFKKEMAALMEQLFPDTQSEASKKATRMLCERLEGEIEDLSPAHIDPRYITSLIVRL